MFENLAGLVKLIGISIILILLWIILSLYSGDSFLETGNLTNLMRRVSIFSILGIGVAMVIMIGGIDLSLGSVVCLTACCLALFLHVDYQPIDSLAVYSINKSDSTAVVERSDQLSDGQVLRLYQTDRNRSSTFVVDSIETLADQSNRLLLKLSAGRFQRDMKSENGEPIGRLAVAIGVSNLRTSAGTESDSSSVGKVILGKPTSSIPISVRDKIWLVRSSGDFKEQTITEVENSEQLVAKLDMDSSLNGEAWFGIPLMRQQAMSVPMAIAASIAVATLLGLLHGVLVTWLKLQPFVVTLCGLLAYRGIARLLSNDQSVGFGTEYVESLNWFSMGKVPLPLSVSNGFTLEFPYAFFVFLVIAVMVMVLMNYTIWGRYMLALGSNEEATRLSGINTDRVKLLAYTLCGLLAGICGVLFAIDSGSISPSSAGSYFELYAIAAAVLGGCSLRGGEGSILGVIIGTILMQTLNNMIVLLGIPNTFEQINLGGVILMAVIADEIVRRYFARNRRNSSQQNAS